MNTENLLTLKIHKLTQAQYDRELANGSIDGIGTASNNGYRVMKRIDENHIKVLVK